MATSTSQRPPTAQVEACRGRHQSRDGIGGGVSAEARSRLVRRHQASCDGRIVAERHAVTPGTSPPVPGRSTPRPGASSATSSVATMPRCSSARGREPSITTSAAARSRRGPASRRHQRSRATLRLPAFKTSNIRRDRRDAVGLGGRLDLDHVGPARLRRLMPPAGRPRATTGRSPPIAPMAGGRKPAPGAGVASTCGGERRWWWPYGPTLRQLRHGQAQQPRLLQPLRGPDGHRASPQPPPRLRAPASPASMPSQAGAAPGRRGGGVTVASHPSAAWTRRCRHNSSGCAGRPLMAVPTGLRRRPPAAPRAVRTVPG